MTKTKVITHNGRAHLDEYLACAIVGAKLVEQGEEIEIIRKDQPTEEELNDPAIWVLDFGKRHEPELKNFDHHQMVGGAVCAFTLVLEYFGMRDYDALPWIKFTETHDHSGGTKAMELVGGGDFNLIFSPIQAFILQRFSETDLSDPESQDCCAIVLISLGEYIIQGHKDYHDTYAQLQKAEIKEINGFRVADYNYIPRNFPLNFNAAKKFEQENGVDIVYTFNDRGASKFRMIRKNENVDFNQAKDVDTVSFVHQSGFLICFDCAPEEILSVLKK